MKMLPLKQTHESADFTVTKKIEMFSSVLYVCKKGEQASRYRRYEDENEHGREKC